MLNKSILRQALLQAALAAVYIAWVAVLMTNGETLFGRAQSVLAVVAFLLLFVVSAAVMGVTIFGKAMLWYLDGAKREALVLVFYTLSFLFILTVVFLVALAI